MYNTRIIFLLSSKNESNLAWQNEEKYQALGTALELAGFSVETATWKLQNLKELEEQLVGYLAVLVWVNPVDRNLETGDFERMLKRVQKSGTYLGGDPDVIQRIGTKSVLLTLSGTSWVPEAFLHSTVASLQSLKTSLDAGKIRVLKQHRGNDGLGVYKLEKTADKNYLATEANSGTEVQGPNLHDVLVIVGRGISETNPMVEVPWADSLLNGIVRCYFCKDRVVGFGYQEINALYPLQIPQEIKRQRFYLTHNCGLFAGLKKRIVEHFLPELCKRTNLEGSSLPILWDADFFVLNPATNQYELCEINASCVSPFPPSAISYVVAEMKNLSTFN